VADDIELAPTGPGQVRVRVAACGICHSDLSLVSGNYPIMGPTIPGHEAAGEVLEVGAGVDHVKVGDHVILSPVPSCGHCRACRRGRFSHCSLGDGLMTSSFADGSTGLSRNGQTVYRGLNLAGWAEEGLVAGPGAIKIPKEVPLDTACVIGCAVQTGTGAALNTADIQPGDSVLIVGAGGIGVSIAAGAAVAGASRIIVSDPSEGRRERAMTFGATHVVDPTSTNLSQVVGELTEGGVDTAFEAVGSAALAEECVASTVVGGEVILVGAAPLTDAMTLGSVATMFSGKSVRGCLLGGCWGPRDIPRMVDLWRAGQLPLDDMVTARRPLVEVNEAVADANDAVGLRTVLVMD
jgi:Zn-dependent alcohol dehydrogenase